MKQIFLLFLFFLFFFINPFKGSTQTTNLQDSLALVDLYNRTNGPGWIKQTNWLTASPINAWYGVTIEAGRVTRLLLSKNKLVGTLPFSLGDLSSLNILDLKINQITGSIPSSLGNFSQLWDLNLSYNQLSGTVPSSLNTIPDYCTINLSYNQLTFAGLEGLTGSSIFVYFPQADIPLKNNGNLLSVSAGGTLSKNTYKWYKDDVLIATKTGDSTYSIASPGNYSVIVTNSIATQLTLYSIGIANIQDSLALVDLYNSTNGPGWINSTNWLTAPVSTWHGVTIRGSRVTNLQLFFNGLINNLPSSLGYLSNLDNLSLDNNQLSGSIPSSLGNLSNLTRLDLNNNQLNGSIPSSLGNLSNLKNLLLYTNQLTGNIPSEIFNIQNLGTVYLHSNQLTGNIPSAVGNASSLYWFQANHNQLSGNIPASFGKLSKLVAITVNNNQLSGSIPDSLCSLPKLGRLELFNNQLTGKIPDSLGNLLELFSLVLNNNRLNGPIPSLTKLTRLSNFSIQDNGFTFDGMETLPNARETRMYAPQANIPLNRTGNLLSVSPGGTLANNTFRLYKNGVLTATQTGDSIFVITTPGNYYISVTNAVATQLTLYSNTDSSAFRFNSIANGNWNDPSIWAEGVVPTLNAQVIISSKVTITTDVTCYSLRIEPPAGNLIINSGINLTVTH